MKKIISILLILLVAFTSVFAASTTDEDLNGNTNEAYSFIAKPFTKTSARIMSMGGAGLAVRNNQDALFVNPASLGEKGLVWNVPNVAVTLFNPYKFVEENLLDKVIAGDFENMSVEEMTPILGILGTNVGNLARVDAGIGVKWGRFATSTDIQVNLNTYAKESVTDIQIVPQVDVVQSLGLGLRFFREKPFNFDVGVAARFNARVYMQGVKALSLVPSSNGGQDGGSTSDNPMDTVLSNNAVLAGYAIPIDIGVNVNMPLGFTVSAVVKNLNGDFKFVRNESINEVQKNPSADVMFGDPAFKTKVPWTLNTGFGWSPDFGGYEWIGDVTIGVDIVDVLHLFNESNFVSNFFSSLKLGAEVQLFKGFEFRAGLNQGYPSVGVGLNIFNVLHLEASYYTVEMGKTVGDKDVDALTIRFSTFWER